jgi:hypothetical protein
MDSATKGHLGRELLTITRMVEIYCRAHHGGAAGALCDECGEFMDYAGVRLEKCPYGEDKPTCTNCPIHCYKPEKRDQAKAIMRYAGPRMIFRHPWLAITHKLDGFRNARHPKELTREQRLRSRDD